MQKDFKQIHSNLLSFRKTFTIVIIVNFVIEKRNLLFFQILYNSFQFIKLFLFERSVFDFMGYMYGMILADIFYFIVLIVGLFGAYQYRVNYVVTVN